jgi:hypothetical protein
VKDLADSVLAVSLLKRENGVMGPAEEAGLRLGDIIFGVNYVPTKDGSKTLIKIFQRESRDLKKPKIDSMDKSNRHSHRRKYLHIQAWRW